MYSYGYECIILIYQFLREKELGMAAMGLLSLWEHTFDSYILDDLGV